MFDPKNKQIWVIFNHSNLLGEWNGCLNINIWTQTNYVWGIFTHLQLCVAVARHNRKWLKI